MVGEHDAARADADGRGARCDVSNYDGSRCARDAWHAVVFSEPVSLEAQGLRMPRQVQGIAQ